MSRYIDADLLQEDFKADHGGKRSLMIDTQPTADVRKNIRGEWKDFRGNKVDVMKWVDCRCSVCGNYSDRATDFCPNCGADMRDPIGEREVLEAMEKLTIRKGGNDEKQNK